MSSDANKRQVGGIHYAKGAIQHWDLVAMYGWDYFQGQISRYMMRWRDKDGIKDLEKMAHVAQKYVEVEKARAAGTLTIGILRDALAMVLDEREAQREAQQDHADSLGVSEPLAPDLNTAA